VQIYTTGGFILAFEQSRDGIPTSATQRSSRQPPFQQAGASIAPSAAPAYPEHLFVIRSYFLIVEKICRFCKSATTKNKPTRLKKNPY
jgi:hypothetical protein